MGEKNKKPTLTSFFMKGMKKYNRQGMIVASIMMNNLKKENRYILLAFFKSESSLFRKEKGIIEFKRIEILINKEA